MRRIDIRIRWADMPTLDRRQFLKLAAALGATLAWGCAPVRPSSSGWRERRDLYPQGVASGDPDDNSVLLWTRRPYADGRERATLLVEVAEDPAFTRVIATTAAPVLAAVRLDLPRAGRRPAAGPRILVPLRRRRGQRQPDRPHADGARRPTIRARRASPSSVARASPRARNAYRRMICEDERARARRTARLRAAPGRLHLRSRAVPGAGQGRPSLRPPHHLPDQVPAGQGDRQEPLHGAGLAGGLSRRSTTPTCRIPTCRMRARACRSCAMWDNHEFSWKAGSRSRNFPAPRAGCPRRRSRSRPTRPGSNSSRRGCCRRAPGWTPSTRRTWSTRWSRDFDDDGLGTEANNLAAINSLIAYRALRWGRHIDLILTDQRSFRSRDPGNHDEINPLFEGDTLGFVPEELWAQLDGGRDYANGNPPAKLSLRRQERRQLPRRRSRADDAGREAEGLVPRAPARCEGHLEDLGQFAGHARLARRSAEPPGRRRHMAARASASWPPATGAACTTSAPRSSMPCAMPASPASRSSPAIATASGPATPPRPCRPRPSNPWASAS